LVPNRQLSPVKLNKILPCSLSNFGGNLPVYINRIKYLYETYSNTSMNEIVATLSKKATQ